MKKTLFGLVIFAAVGLMFLSSVWLATSSSAQTSDERMVADVLRQNAVAFTKNDMATMSKIWADSPNVIVFESGHANYGWADYRDTHLAPEMKEMKNTKYEFTDIKTKVSGKMAYATMKYSISADIGTHRVDGAGLATAVLEKFGKNWRIVHWHSSAPRRAAFPTPSPAKKP
jgi:ketosteroid isomerase-like protein